MHTQAFHVHLVPRLRERGIEVRYICSGPDALGRYDPIATDCILHSAWDAIAGRLPDIPDWRLRIRHPDDWIIKRMAPHESMVFQTMDRMNRRRMKIQDLKRVYFRYVAMWQTLIDRERPDSVVFNSPPHIGYDYVLYIVCQSLGIPTWIVHRTFIPDRMMIVDSLENVPCPPADYAERDTSDSTPAAVLNGYDSNYYDARNAIWEDNSGRRFNKLDRTIKSAASALFFLYQMVRRPHMLRKPFYASAYGLEPRMPSYFVHQWRFFLDSLEMNRLREFYESRTEAPNQAHKYIYFALQTQPEVSSVPLGFGFSDQLRAVDLLLEALPAGWRLYVKEHPRQFVDNPQRCALGRSQDFYQHLERDDRIQLISTSVHSKALLAGSRCAASVAGTVGWEAVQAGVPTIVFGAPWYVYCPGVYRVETVREARNVLQQIDSGAQTVDARKLEIYKTWMSTNGTFRAYFTDIYGESSAISAEENAYSYAEAIEARMGPIPHGAKPVGT